MPSEMPGVNVRVTSLVNGRTEEAILLKCIECNGDQFVALLIGPSRNLHLQCAICGNSHCAHDSECHQEERRN